jgi:hexosaminidase
MKYLTIVFLATTVSAASLNVMPMPAKVDIGTGKLAIDGHFGIEATGCNDPRITAAVKRFEQRISKRTGMPLTDTKPVLTLHCEHAGAPVQKLGEDESYQLTVTSDHARLTAPNALGVLRGLETFVQLIERNGGGWAVPALTIEDSPRFPWRGLHIDVSRHWIPLDVILRNLDGMAAVKLNVFHWHLTDDQGFRIESKRYPKLHELGSDGNYYTQDQVRQVIAYARDRGIRVVPEFDMPAHATAWLVGYPELGSAPGPYEIGRHWGIFEPTMDPTRESTYVFLDNFIGEMARLFPDEYFHIGGDEVNNKQWDASEHIQAFKKQHHLADNAALQAYFNKRVQAIVKKHGKRMEGWDEILDPALPKDIVIQSWRGLKSLAQAARMGYDGMLSTPYYLDAMKSAAEYYKADPLSAEADSLTPEEKKRILGGEVCTWAEFLTPENIDSRIWPRTAAVAERFWSPAGVTDAGSMYQRLDALNRELDFLGLKHNSNYQVMLERLAMPGQVGPMNVLADVVNPVRLGLRARTRTYLQQDPLNRLADAAQPDSPTARRFSDAVDRRDWQEVRRWLILWRDNDARLRPQLERDSLTQELMPLSADLSAVALAGLQALDAIEAGHKPPDISKLLDRAKQPRAELILAIVPAIEKLTQSH